MRKDFCVKTGLCFLFLCAAVFVFAAGSKDIDTINIDSMKSWQEKVDISSKKKGKYNILITAQDIAGNVEYVGPFNLFIDPDSDLPVNHIAFPVEGSRITGTVDIIGVSIDDDGVAGVELTVDGGTDVYTASGKEFWSYSLSTADMEEGIHTVQAVAIDINGVRGKPVKTFFYLDQKQPLTNITNTETGVLVSGKIKFEGTVEDGNGIDRLSYSLDGGNTFQDIGLSHNKKEGVSRFKIDIDTTKISDGPNVCWFKAVDKQGSVGIYTFLFFVDNVPPSISFIYPDDDNETFPSIFSIAGKAVDGTGLASIKWVCGKESDDIPVLPGNQYWVKEFDFSKVNTNSAVIEIIAEDVAGNIVHQKKKVLIDKNKDKPVTELKTPLNDIKLDADNIFVSGLCYGEVPVDEVRYRVDKQEEKSAAVVSGAFGFMLEDLPAGNHTLTVYAVSRAGVAGVAKSVKFYTNGKAPSITFENGEHIIPAVSAGSKVSTAIRIKAEAGLQQLTWSINGGAETPVEIRAGQSEYVLKTGITEKMPSGLYTVSVAASDTAGRTTTQTLLAAVFSAAQTEQTAEETRFVWAQNNSAGDDFALIDENTPLIGFYYSGNKALISNAELTAPEDISCQVEGNIIKLTALKSGIYKDVRIKITDDTGAETETAPLNLLADNQVPVIKIEQAQEPLFVTDTISFSGTVSDDTELQSLSYALYADGPDALLEGSLETSFKRNVDISSFPDGVLRLEVSTADKAGQKYSAYRIFVKDTQAPEVRMISPPSGENVNGSVTAAFKVTERFNTVKAEYKASAESSAWQEFDYNSLPHIVIGSAAEPISEKMLFRFTDAVGNVRTIDSYGFQIDNGADAPVVEIHLPFEDEIIVKDFTLSGIAYDDDAIAHVYYKIDDGDYYTLDVTHSFAVPFALSAFTDNEHTLTVYAEDIYGVKSEPVERKIRVSLEAPVAEMTAPLISETVKGEVKIAGTASDKNGIKEVRISVNNGNIFCAAEGTTNWEYKLNTSVIGDGTHVVFIRAIDNYGQESLSSSLINIDNTPPSLKIEYPLAGSALDTDLFVSGQTRDNIQLEGVTLKIRSLSGTTVPAGFAEIKLKTELLLAEDLDISSFPAGRYNLEISGVDKAGNTSQTAVNFDIVRKEHKDKIALLYPLNGENLCGEFNIYGCVDQMSNIKQVSLYIDGTQVETVDVSKTHYVAFRANKDILSDGLHTIEIKGILPNNQVVVSGTHSFMYSAAGPWITIDNLHMGDFAIERPYLRGRASYNLSDEEEEMLISKKVSAEEKRIIAAKRVKKVEVSFDNGKTFVPARLGKEWKFRIETEDMAEGNHFLLVRAVMENKEIAICRTIVKIDKELPNITLISPGEGGRYNGEMTFIGLTSDNVGLQSVEAALRKGDKSAYGLPKFIQGLHVEAGVWGATLWNIGLGLNFFDDNVKLQIHYGQFTQKQFDAITGAQKLEKRPQRYGGHVGSLKLLANITEQPFGYYFGPDWRWLYLNVAIGAQFSIFGSTQSGKPQVLSAVLAQVEFPRVKLYKQKYFSSFSFFTEGQLWFIPTDVNSVNVKSLVPHICGGVRVNIF